MSQIDPKPVSLETLGGGVLAEKFGVSWRRVIDNVMDPNTKLSVVREVNIKIKVKPSEDRDVNNVEIECTEKLAPDFGFGTMVYVGKDIHGKHEAYESNPRQQQLQFKEMEKKPEPENAAGDEKPKTTNVRVMSQ